MKNLLKTVQLNNMATFTVQQFVVKIDKQIAGLQLLVDRKLPVVIGKAAVDYFKGSFDRQAWERKPWKEVQRRTPGTRAYNYNSKHHPTRLSRGILIGDNADMKRSLQYETQPSNVNIVSDLPYFEVHNRGLMAGRKGHQFRMPKRQSVGTDPHVKQIIQNEITHAMNHLMK